MDIVSWLISHPESVAIGRDLQTLIWQADQGVASGSEVTKRGQKLQSELEALKKVMPGDALAHFPEVDKRVTITKFIDCCIFAVGDLVKEFGNKEGAPAQTRRCITATCKFIL